MNDINKKIGYIINESGFQMESIDLIDSTSSLSPSRRDEIKFHNPDHIIGYGVLQTADVKNRNGRIYRKSDLIREINAPRQRELLSTGNLIGEKSHPLSTELIRQQTIDPKNACVRFHNLWMEGDNVMAYFEGTNDEAGTTFDKDLRIGVKPAFSLRALGTIKATPQGNVVENLKMITYDYVIYPSHPTAYTHGVLNESSSLLSSTSGEPVSNFKFSNANDARRSFIKEFTNQDVVNSISTIKNEAAMDMIREKSLNYKLLEEYYELNNFDMVDIINDRQVALTEAGNSTIIMDIDDYIVKEIQNYR